MDPPRRHTTEAPGDRPRRGFCRPSRRILAWQGRAQGSAGGLPPDVRAVEHSSQVHVRLMIMSPKRIFVVIPAILLAVAGCSSGTNLNLQEGWDWSVKYQVGLDTGEDFDWTTGALSGEEDMSQNLSLRKTPGSSDSIDLYAEAEDTLCQQYVDSDSGGFDQSNTIWQLLDFTRQAAIARDFSPEYQKAYADVKARVEENGPSLDGITVFDENFEHTAEWNAAWDARWALETQYWSDNYSNLDDEKKQIADRTQLIWDQAFTESMVRKAQEFVVETCDIVVPDGYVYPSAEDLGITLPDAS